jgi:hypothetical protein
MYCKIVQNGNNFFKSLHGPLISKPFWYLVLVLSDAGVYGKTREFTGKTQEFTGKHRKKWKGLRGRKMGGKIQENEGDGTGWLWVWMGKGGTGIQNQSWRTSLATQDHQTRILNPKNVRWFLWPKNEFNTRPPADATCLLMAADKKKKRKGRGRQILR